MTIRVTNIVIPLSDLAMSLEEELAEILIPPEPGYYTLRGSQPALRPNKQYHQMINGVSVPVVLPTDIKANVYDAEGECVYNFPKSQRVELFTRPMVPTVGLRIIQAYVDHVLSEQLHWVLDNKSMSVRLKDYLLVGEPTPIPEINGEPVTVLQARHAAFVAEDPRRAKEATPQVSMHREEALTLQCERRIKNILRNLMEELIRFIGEDTWHYYYLKIKARDLYVEKGSDFRITEWTRLKEEGVI